ncbi:iron-containing alcohol dehydrogenase [Blautia obeum]|uniref:iron-containing alcohol dehydrogenase n=1 Tax=Blautia obeum TaxID=40520 RepID=UPI001570AB07|nr:iron-containing alcohol dehydrogenase [Blautia obeum]NSG18732.1 iron-containing alcohol dehydrogenase [Blautia obeum]
MRSFEYFAPTKVIFGKDSHLQIGDILKKENCHKVLIHYGGKSAVASGLIDEVSGCLTDAGIDFVTLGGVVPNPRLSKVREGIELCKKENVDFILAVGGGSVIDSAKAIGYGVANPWTDVWNFYLKTEVPTACLPIGVIPTIAASGSEMSNSSVITNEDGWLKRGAAKCDLCRPKFALMNPKLTYSLPQYQTESGCVDILMHTMERYFVNIETMEITDSISESLMQTVIYNARILMREPDNYTARAEIMWAGSLSHNGLTGCGTGGGDWACHQLEHELGGLYDVTHDAGLAAIWGSWARYVYDVNPERFAQFATNVFDIPCGLDFEKTALAGIEAMEDFFRSIKMPVSLHELGLDLDDQQIHELAFKCSYEDTRTIGVFKQLNMKDMEKIYTMAR